MIRYPIGRRQPLALELEEFVHAVRSDQPFHVTGQDGVEALALAHRLVRAGQEHKSLFLDGSGSAGL